jgi:hypothetical protein
VWKCVLYSEFRVYSEILGVIDTYVHLLQIGARKGRHFCFRQSLGSFVADRGRKGEVFLFQTDSGVIY